MREVVNQLVISILGLHLLSEYHRWYNASQWYTAVLTGTHRKSVHEVCSIASLPVMLIKHATFTDAVDGRADTFLAFMEYWRAGVINAIFLGISKVLPTSLMNTLRCHIV